MSLEYDAHHRMRARIGTPIIADDPERDAQILGWMAGRDWTRQGEIIRACAEDLRPSMSPKTARKRLEALAEDGRLEMQVSADMSAKSYRLPPAPAPEPRAETAKPPARPRRRARRRRSLDLHVHVPDRYVTVASDG